VNFKKRKIATVENLGVIRVGYISAEIVLTYDL